MVNKKVKWEQCVDAIAQKIKYDIRKMMINRMASHFTQGL